MTSWPKCCDLRLCGLRFCERRMGSALDSLHELLRAAPCRLRTCEDGKRRKMGASLEPAQKSAPCELRGARCDRRNGLPAPLSASCERCSASCNRASAHAWPRCCELQSASCGLRLAHSSRIAPRGLRLADCGSRVCSQTKQLCRHHAHMPGIDSASCNLRRAPCGRPTTRGLRLAERRLATRKRVERRHSTADCKLHVAARRMRPSGTKVNGLLRTFSDS